MERHTCKRKESAAALLTSSLPPDKTSKEFRVSATGDWCFIHTESVDRINPPILAGDHNVSLLIQDHDHGNHGAQSCVRVSYNVSEGDLQPRYRRLPDGVLVRGGGGGVRVEGFYWGCRLHTAMKRLRYFCRYCSIACPLDRLALRECRYCTSRTRADEPNGQHIAFLPHALHSFPS